jgi:hypothetical protein
MLTYFCFIESRRRSTPHMEPLAADNAADARREARALMRGHADAVVAHVTLGDVHIATLR